MADPRLLPDIPAPQYFSRLEQWGWEFRDTRTVAEPFPLAQPTGQVGVPEWAKWASDQQKFYAGKRTQLITYTATGGLVTVLCGVFIGLAVSALPLLGLSGLAWFAWGRPFLLAKRADREHQAWLRHCVRQQEKLFIAMQEWATQENEHFDRQAEGLSKTPRWVSMRPIGTGHIDVCGGSSAGWRALLDTSGQSMLASGHHITVLDLSHETVTADLVAAARAGGHRVDVITLPDQRDSINCLAGVPPEDAGRLLAEAIYGADRAGTASDRQLDTTVLTALSRALQAPLTFARIAAALRWLLERDDSSNPGSADDSLLTTDELDRVARLVSAAVLRTSEPRLVHLASTMESLINLDGTGVQPLFDGTAAGLRVVEINPKMSSSSASLVSQVLFQLLLIRMSNEDSTGTRPVSIVCGADILRREHVEGLDRIARLHDIRQIVMFRHLRDDAVDLLGRGDAALIMKLGNATEAEYAANFIGREHKLVASQFTISRGESTTLVEEENKSDTEGTFSSTTDSRTSIRGHALGGRIRGSMKTHSETDGVSESHTVGASRSTGAETSRMESISFQRTYDYAVTPQSLQRLSPTAFVLIDPQDQNSPRLGDCDPQIRHQPGVVDSDSDIRSTGGVRR